VWAFYNLKLSKGESQEEGGGSYDHDMNAENLALATKRG
jgi:hypothetical protein